MEAKQETNRDFIPKLGEENHDEAAVLPAATNRIPPPRMMFLLLL